MLKKKHYVNPTVGYQSTNSYPQVVILKTDSILLLGLIPLSLGEFKNGRYFGSGKLTRMDSSVLTGTFINGLFVNCCTSIHNDTTIETFYERGYHVIWLIRIIKVERDINLILR